MTDQWFVTCEDGERRHGEPFATIHDAKFWAAWGHCCTTRHTYTREDAR